MKAPWLPRSVAVPEGYRTGSYRVRPLTVHDAVRDYDAVMTSRERLWARFGPGWGWPAENLTLEDDLVDLAWHQKEFALRTSFAYTITTPDGSRVLGCLYLFPSRRADHDAEVYFWSREPADGGIPEDVLDADVRRWLREAWPFTRVAFPGRDIPWSEWGTQP